MKNNNFDKALGDFVRDVAYGDAIRHLTEKGYTPLNIKEQLGYPVSVQIIGEIMLKYLFETGKVLTDKPSDKTVLTDEKYVCDVDRLGRKSFRRVVSNKEPISEEDYLAIDFSQMKADAPKDYERLLSSLCTDDADYVDNIPWPCRKLYHCKNDRIIRINQALQDITCD